MQNYSRFLFSKIRRYIAFKRKCQMIRTAICDEDIKHKNDLFFFFPYLYKNEFVYNNWPKVGSTPHSCCSSSISSQKGSVHLKQLLSPRCPIHARHASHPRRAYDRSSPGIPSPHSTARSLYIDASAAAAYPQNIRSPPSLSLSPYPSTVSVTRDAEPQGLLRHEDRRSPGRAGCDGAVRGHDPADGRELPGALHRREGGREEREAAPLQGLQVPPGHTRLHVPGTWEALSVNNRKF